MRFLRKKSLFSAFRECRSLAIITIPDSVTDIGDRFFEGCSCLEASLSPWWPLRTVLRIGFWETISIPHPWVWEGRWGLCISAIMGRVFSGCSVLDSITIPASAMTITDSGIVMPAKQLHHGKAQEISLPNGVGMPPQDAGIAIFPAHRLPESVTGIRNGSLWSVASVIDRRRAWHRVLPWNFVF